MMNPLRIGYRARMTSVIHRCSNADRWSGGYRYLGIFTANGPSRHRSCGCRGEGRSWVNMKGKAIVSDIDVVDIVLLGEVNFDCTRTLIGEFSPWRVCSTVWLTFSHSHTAGKWRI